MIFGLDLRTLTPQCFQSWLKMYDHVCPAVTAGATRDAYKAADQMLAARALTLSETKGT